MPQYDKDGKLTIDTGDKATETKVLMEQEEEKAREREKAKGTSKKARALSGGSVESNVR